MSKWSVGVMDQLDNRFPNLRGGHVNCRKIARTETWSQHSWPNARDLYHVHYGYSTDPRHQEYLDEVYAFLVTHKRDLSIRTIIWRKKDHFNHIHIDGYPRGYGTPSCAGGTYRMQYSTGEIVNGDPGPEFGLIELPDKEIVTVTNDSTIREGDRGLEVALVQQDLIDLGYDLGSWPPLVDEDSQRWGYVFSPGADGVAGPAFTGGVTLFQGEASLKVTGVADGVTVALLHKIAEHRRSSQ
jgi:hypothetical protein